MKKYKKEIKNKEAGSKVLQKKLKAGLEIFMEFQIGDKITMKKPHPCGTNAWEVLRVGLDFRLRCTGCGHVVMLPRKTVEKSFRGKLTDELTDES